MSVSRFREISIDAFLDNFTLGGLTGKLRIPASPTAILDSRSLDELLTEQRSRVAMRRQNEQRGLAGQVPIKTSSDGTVRR